VDKLTDELSEIKLTQFAGCAGCAAKIAPDFLRGIISTLDIYKDNTVLSDSKGFEDAGVVKISDDKAIVMTTDFFPPVVDDPYFFGQIATANALSDIYAMGAVPKAALALVGFPATKLPKEVFEQIMKGCTDKLREAKVNLVGGHSIKNPEPFFGTAVFGECHPDDYWKNSTAKVTGDIILTKPLGTGILNTALKMGKLNESQIKKTYEIMASLNEKAANIARQFPIDAVTDVTGFGLIGHSSEVAKASNVGIKLFYDKLKFIDSFVEIFAKEGMIPGATSTNIRVYESDVLFPDGSQYKKNVLFDPQTSGGLLIFVPHEHSDELLQKLIDNGMIHAVKIGQTTKEHSGKIEVL